MPYRLSERSLKRLEGVHPRLVRVVEVGLGYSPHDFAVAEGVRKLERQRELVARGSSLTLNSRHLVQADGWGHAVDIVAVGDLDGDGDIDAQDRARTWDRRIYTMIAVSLKVAADELKTPVRWGGDFRAFFDGPHFELVG
jgi:peptidoglycan L-alanyl-D-glutamate endopeptidase CwlK